MKKNIFGLISFIIAFVSILFSVIMIILNLYVVASFSFILPILGAILGGIGLSYLKKCDKLNWMTIVGVVLNILIALTIILLVRPLY